MPNKELFSDLLRQADIEINGDRPWDITINDERLKNRHVLACRFGVLDVKYLILCLVFAFNESRQFD
ncbi:hypothetical protein ACP5PY_26045 [Photobacterium leiognathi subsp. mandapamensis]